MQLVVREDPYICMFGLATSTWPLATRSTVSRNADVAGVEVGMLAYHVFTGGRAFTAIALGYGYSWLVPLWSFTA